MTLDSLLAESRRQTLAVAYHDLPLSPAVPEKAEEYQRKLLRPLRHTPETVRLVARHVASESPQGTSDSPLEAAVHQINAFDAFVLTVAPFAHGAPVTEQWFLNLSALHSLLCNPYHVQEDACPHHSAHPSSLESRFAFLEKVASEFFPRVNAVLADFEVVAEHRAFARALPPANSPADLARQKGQQTAIARTTPTAQRMVEMARAFNATILDLYAVREGGEELLNETSGAAWRDRCDEPLRALQRWLWAAGMSNEDFVSILRRPYGVWIGPRAW